MIPRGKVSLALQRAEAQAGMASLFRNRDARKALPWPSSPRVAAAITEAHAAANESHTPSEHKQQLHGLSLHYSSVILGR
jgi:hypothetical protein